MDLCDGDEVAKELGPQGRAMVVKLHAAIYELFNELDADPNEGLLACITSAAFAARYPPERLAPLPCKDFLAACKRAYLRVCKINRKAS